MPGRISRGMSDRAEGRETIYEGRPSASLTRTRDDRFARTKDEKQKNGKTEELKNILIYIDID